MSNGFGSSARVVGELARAPDRLVEFPRIGEKLPAYEPREVRRIIVGDFEMRYEIAAGTIFILRLWHCCEKRSFAVLCSKRTSMGIDAIARKSPMYRGWLHTPTQ